jgi:DNA-binding IclR family transcriptional regulator
MAADYVHRLDGGRCCLGHAVAPLYNAYLSSVSLHTHLSNALNKLGEVTKETAYLCVWHNGHALIQAMVEGSQAVRVGGLYVGFMGNTHLRASGKALLAYLDKQELDAYLTTADFSPLTANSVCDPEELMEQLQEVVKRGYAVDRGEFAEDVNCAAAPVFSAEGKVVAVLAISAPRQRFVQKEDQLVGAVVQAASNASCMLGYKSSKQSDAETAPVRDAEVSGRVSR